MRKLIATLCLLCSAFATDVRVAGGTKYGVLTGIPIATVVGRDNQLWTNINNAYIIDNIAPDSGVCFAFLNNDGSSHTATVTAFTTSTLLAPAFLGGTGNDWVQVPISPPVASGLYTFTATAQTQLYVRTPAAAHTVLNISGASGSGNVRIDYAQTGAGCGTANQWKVSEVHVGATACNTSAGIIAAQVGVRHVANCVSVSANTSVATSFDATWDIRDGGVAGNCTTGTVIWNGTIGFSAAIGNASNIAVCGLNISGTTGNSLQICAEQTQVASQQCTSSMSGYDQ